ncbi:MAG: NADH-quinone oxidoreductase subunit D [Armatimonadetes bacterium]|nr:NADH-quinone oxidoreductase subunit D [Armatimonadota bacterium]
MIKTEEFLINMGPQHPSTHGVLRLILKLEGEKVIKATPVIGYLHRSLEKMAENRTYHQYIPLTDRLDYVTSMAGNFAYVLAVEKLLDIQIPQRAEFIRVIMLEYNRIASHLLWYGTLALDLGATTPFIYAFREREKILDLFEATCGNRLTYNYYRLGGVSFDLPENFIEYSKKFLKLLKEKMPDYEDLLTSNIIFLGRTKDKGIISSEEALNYGLTGPNLRASGIKWDIRRGEPFSIYPQLDFEIPTGNKGDIWDRYYLRLEEIRQSIKIIEQCLEKLPSGKHKINLPLKVKPKKGEIYSRIESSRGEMGFYIISDGSLKPYRVKIRAPSFSNLSIISKLLEGEKVADIVAILGSLDIILPEIDR